MKLQLLFIAIISILLNQALTQYCNLQDNYTVSFGANYPNNVVQKTIMQEYTHVFANTGMDFYYNVTSELIGGLYFSFPYSVLVNQQQIGERISVSYDGTYDIYLITYHTENFLLTDLQTGGWTQVLPTEMKSSGAYGQPYSIFKKTGFQTTLSPINNYWFLGGVLIKNCQQNTPCPNGQYRDISTNICVACPDSSCDSCLYANNRQHCTSCDSSKFLSLETFSCVENTLTCSQISTDSFFIPTAGSYYVIPDNSNEALTIYQLSNDCPSYLSIVQTNLNLRQSCPSKLNSFIWAHTSNFLKIFLKGCDVVSLVNTIAPNSIDYPAQICQVYGDPWIRQFDGFLQTCQNVYNQKMFFQNQNLTIQVTTVPLVPGTSAVVIVDFNYNNVVVLQMMGGVLPASTSGFVNGVQINTTNSYKSEFTFDQLPTTKVWVQVFANSFFLVGVDSPLDNNVNTNTLCFYCSPSRRILFDIIEQPVCSTLELPYKTSCNFDVSALHSEQWAEFSQIAQDLYYVQEEYSVNNALASIKKCNFGEYKDENNICQSCYWQSLRGPSYVTWCQDNCCVLGTQNIQDGSNIHSACNDNYESDQFCKWQCPGQTESNGCNIQSTSTTTTQCNWTTLPNFQSWQWFCDLYCAQGAWECTSIAGANQICSCI